MDGVLNIDKPSGMTSHDVVQAVRRIAGEKRVGHTGTLDPLATGVLVLCLGKATRIAQYLEAGEKEYRAVMKLGETTDTLDADGVVLETRAYTPPPMEKIREATKEFIGEIQQRPPVYSAIKIGGVPSYKLARRGEAEALKPRTVTIHEISVTGFEDPLVSVTVRCSKGVYIRSLCADIGESLGMGAHLTSLVRTRSGRFRIDDAATLGRLAEVAARGQLQELLVPMDTALVEFPIVTVDAEESRKILHGNRISLRQPLENAVKIRTLRIHDDSGRLLALATIDQGWLKPELVFS